MCSPGEATISSESESRFRLARSSLSPTCRQESLSVRLWLGRHLVGHPYLIFADYEQCAGRDRGWYRWTTKSKSGRERFSVPGKAAFTRVRGILVRTCVLVARKLLLGASWQGTELRQQPHQPPSSCAPATQTPSTDMPHLHRPYPPPVVTSLTPAGLRVYAYQDDIKGVDRSAQS
jgi:hypothetical protein